MKSFKQYLIESVRTYKCKIKLVGEYDDKTLDLLRMNLKKFHPVKIGDAKKTPIQVQPYDFTNFLNEPVTILDCEFHYPATEPMIKQMWRLCGHDENRIRLVDELDVGDREVMDREILTHEGDEALDAEAKKASEAYGDSYLAWLKDQRKATEYKQEFAGQTTPVHDPFKVDRESSLGPISGKNRR